MPFTLTHVVAAVPIARVGAQFPFSAIVVGCMVPDLPMFLPIGLSSGFTHTAVGLVTVCLPVGMLCYWFFHRMMARSMLWLLPRAARVRVGAPSVSARWTFDVTVWAAGAILIGAASHVLWDSFTHTGRWGTDLIPWLQEPLFDLLGRPVRGYKLFQYGSSVLGLPLLALLLVRWLKQRRPGPDPTPASIIPARVVAQALVVLLPMLTATVSCVISPGWPQDVGEWYFFVGHFVRRLGAIGIMVAVAYSITFELAIRWADPSG